MGIPCSLLYFWFYPFWETFFRELGARVVTSGSTNKQILDLGVKEALADACVPVKLYFGHVQALMPEVDFLFVPRLVCLNYQTTYCPKFLGLPDMIRHTFTGSPPLIDIRIDVREGLHALPKAYWQAGRALGAKHAAVARAYLLARKAQRRYLTLLQKGLLPGEAAPGKSSPTGKRPPDRRGRLVFGVLGYPYLVHDPYISVGLIARLQKMGVGVITLENIPPRLLYRQPLPLEKRLFWTPGDLVYRAALYLLSSRRVHGLIHVTAFGCGPDAMVGKYLEQALRRHPEVPFLTLTVDEHTGEAGMATRIEAFVDMVRRPKAGW